MVGDLADHNIGRQPDRVPKLVFVSKHAHEQHDTGRPPVAPSLHRYRLLDHRIGLRGDRRLRAREIPGRHCRPGHNRAGGDQAGDRETVEECGLRLLGQGRSGGAG